MVLATPAITRFFALRSSSFAITYSRLSSGENRMASSAL